MTAPLYVVTGNTDYEGSDVLGAFTSERAAVYLARRHAERRGVDTWYDDITVLGFDGATPTGVLRKFWVER